jgi:DNA-binding transcriptional regulator YiaG
MDDLVRNGVLVNTVQDTDMARPGTQCAKPTPPHTFILDGHLLRQLRHQRGLSQADLADQAGISLTTVARLERQPHAPCRGWTLGRLARAVGQDPTTMTLPQPTD